MASGDRYAGQVTVFVSGMADIKARESLDESGSPQVEWDVQVVPDMNITSRNFLPQVAGESRPEIPTYVRQTAVLGLLENLAKHLRVQLERGRSEVEAGGEVIQMPGGGTGVVGGNGGASA